MSRIFLSAGEASGDHYASRLAHGLSSIPNVHLEGVGGLLSKTAGVELVANSANWGAVGIVEALRVLPHAWSGYQAARRRLAEGKPGVFLPIDFGYMNVKLARLAKQLGWSVVYFIPPGSWRRDRQGKDLVHVCDHIVTPFRWSAEILNRDGAKAHWFGHPLLQLVAEQKAKYFSFERNAIAVLPGSRDHEIEHNLPVIAAALRHREEPIVFGAASNVNRALLLRRWAELGGRSATVEAGASGALLKSKVAIVCSGTATLEAAICDCPMVVIYRGSKAMEIEYRIRRPKIKAISLPNILLNVNVIPELIQWDATPDAILEHLNPICAATKERQAQLDAFAAVRDELGPPTAIDSTIDLIQEVLAARSAAL